MRGPVLQHLSHHLAAITAVADPVRSPGHAEHPLQGAVVVATYDGVINPVSADTCMMLLSEAHSRGAP